MSDGRYNGWCRLTPWRKQVRVEVNHPRVVSKRAVMAQKGKLQNVPHRMFPYYIFTLKLQEIIPSASSISLNQCAR